MLVLVLLLLIVVLLMSRYQPATPQVHLVIQALLVVALVLVIMRLAGLL